MKLTLKQTCCKKYILFSLSFTAYIFLQSLRVGDDILVDLNEQMYRHDQALESFNRTLSSLEKLVSGRSSSGSERNKKEELNPPPAGGGDVYVPKHEFRKLKETLASVKRRVEILAAKNLSNNAVDSSVARARIEQLQQEMTLQRAAIADVSHATDDATRQVNEIRKLLARWLQTNRTSAESGTAAQSRDLSSIVSVLKSIKANVIENRKVINNQRRRFRRVEGEAGMVQCK